MSHFYDNGRGGVYPSVTTILQEILPENPNLARWKRNPNNKGKGESASAIGTICHFRILKKFNPALPPPDLHYSKYPPNARDCAAIAEDMFNSLGITLEHPVFTEHRIVCHERKYAGSLDAAGVIHFEDNIFTKTCTEYNGLFLLIDLKTSASIKDNYLYQLAGYWNAFDWHGKKPDACAIINVHPYVTARNPVLEPKITIFPLETIRDYLEKFLPLVDEYHKRHPQACTLEGMRALGGMKV